MQNVLARPTNLMGGNGIKIFTPKQEKKNPKVISYEKVSSKDEAGIVSFYKVLVSEDCSREIDIKMIWEEAFPAFEETIGADEFAKVKKHFGIAGGCKVKPREREVMSLVGRLRTVENATKYISGYKALIRNVANRLCEEPAGMSELEKAKLIRAFFVIFGEYQFFTEDFSILQYMNKEPERVLKIEHVLQNNKKPFYPEELFFLYEYKIRFFKENSIMYGIIADEFLRLEKKLKKEVLEIAELKVNTEERFISENKAVPNLTFGIIRKLKVKVSPIKGAYPIEIFCNRTTVSQWDFGELYKLYKTLENTDWDNFPREARTEKTIEGSRVTDVTYQVYKVGEDVFSCYQEMSRVKRYIEHLAEMEYVLNTQYIVDEDENTQNEPKARIEQRPVNTGRFMAAIQFAKRAEYISAETTVVRDFEVADALLAKDTDDTWLKYKKGEMSFEEVRESLKIDSLFEQEVLNFKKKETLEEVAIRFAKEQGKSEEEPDADLVANILISGNEVALEKYSAEEIDIKTLKKRIGFDENFAEMYFSLQNVDIPVIEERLMQVKRSMAGKAEVRANALLIKLYCYLIEGQVPCGAKMKSPKRNKGLKPAILKGLIE